MRGRCSAVFWACLVPTAWAGLSPLAGGDPVAPVSRCREWPLRVVEGTTRAGDRADHGEEPPVRPIVLPPNLEVTAVFRPFVDRMWLSSPAFRQQLRRLRAGNGFRVRVVVEDRPSRRLSFNARTVLRPHDHSLVLAEVFLTPSRDTVELIAHELEHILEQLDGVDLKAQAGNGVVWKSGDGHFETRRAIEAGRRVARDIMTASDATEIRDRPLEHHAERIGAVAQQDRDATPSSVRSARVSGSGRYVVFISSARLVEADGNALQDVYVLDLTTGQCTLESVGPGGSPGNGESVGPDISRDGRYVAFESAAGNLSDTPSLPGVFQVFLRDRAQGTTRLLSANASGEPVNGRSGNPALSADGTAVVFESAATDLIDMPEVARNSIGIYLIRLTSGLRTRLDLSSSGGPPAGQSMAPAIAADGRLVVFVSKADLTCGQASACVPETSDKNGVVDIYLRDTEANTTRRISRSYAGGDPDGPSYQPAISGDGRYVAFVSEAPNLTGSSRNRGAHVYVHDLVTGTTELISRTPSGRSANGASLRPALSHDGSRVAFQSLACNLVCEGRCQTGQPDLNLLWDVFVHDRATGQTIRASTDSDGEWMDNSRAPSLDDTGRVLAFGSRHPMNGRDERRDENLYVYRLR